MPRNQIAVQWLISPAVKYVHRGVELQSETISPLSRHLTADSKRKGEKQEERESSV